MLFFAYFCKHKLYTMKRFFLLFILLLTASTTFAQRHRLDSLLSELDAVIERTPEIDAERQQSIYRHRMAFNEAVDDRSRYEHSYILFQRYKKYREDSTYYYARTCHTLAESLHDHELLQQALLAEAEGLMRLARYEEAANRLRQTDRKYVSTHASQYFYLNHSLYYALSQTSSNDEERMEYQRKMRAYRDSIAAIRPSDTSGAVSNISQIMKSEGKYREALAYLVEYEKSQPDSVWNNAVTCTVLAELYKLMGDNMQSVIYLAQASILDKKEGKKSYTALQTLGQQLYEMGDLQHAYFYITTALNDIMFSDARNRLVQVAEFLPIITAAREEAIKKDRFETWIFMLVLGVSIIGLLGLLYVLSRRNKNLAEVKKVLDEKNRELSAHEERLTEHTEELATLNAQLREANKIKEEYIAQLFNICSLYINDMEDYRISLLRKAKKGNEKELLTALNSPVGAKSKKDLFRQFDAIFLELFPNFIEKFNALMNDGERFQPKAGELLSPELRIYALVRLGITDSTKIASFLGYSSQTIYNYRVKVRSHVGIPREEFVERVQRL